MVRYFKKSALITPLLSVFIVVWFFFQVLIFNFISKETWLNIFAFNVKQPLFVWTYITSMISHGSFQHLIKNVFIFSIYGILIETEIFKEDTKKYLFFLFITGLSGIFFQSLVFILFDITNKNALGLSAVVYGILGGSLLITGSSNTIKFHPLFLSLFKTFLLLGFIYELIMAISKNLIGINNNTIGHTAHASAFLIGFIYIFLYLIYTNKI